MNALFDGDLPGQPPGLVEFEWLWASFFPDESLLCVSATVCALPPTCPGPCSNRSVLDLCTEQLLLLTSICAKCLASVHYPFHPYSHYYVHFAGEQTEA